MGSAARLRAVDRAMHVEVDQLRKLTEVGRALTYATSLDQVARIAVERGAAVLDASAAILMLAGPDGLLHVRAAYGVGEERVTRFRAPMEDELIGHLRGLLGVPDDAFIAVPLVVGGAVTGIIAAAVRRSITEADEWMMSALADQAAVALEHARLSGEVRLDMEDRLRASEGETNAKDRALSTLAHDIRSPLAAIDAYCDILQDGLYGEVNERQHEALGRVRMSGQHLLSMLDNVMDMARINASALNLRAVPVDLVAVAREAEHMVAPTCAARLQTLRFQADEDAIVVADGSRVRQVLVNLLGNAVKFTPEGGAITIEVGPRAIDGAAWAEVRVRDTGPGIALTEQAAVFEAYYRSEQASGTAGVGLGLAISRALVEQMGGALELESEPGQGSTFIIRFPSAAAD